MLDFATYFNYEIRNKKMGGRNSDFMILPYIITYN